MKQPQYPPGYHSRSAQESRRVIRSLKQFHKSCVESYRLREKAHCEAFWEGLAGPTERLALYLAALHVAHQVLVQSGGRKRSRLRIRKKDIETMSSEAAQITEGSTIEALRDLAAAAQEGDQEAFSELTQMVREDDEFWRQFRNLDELIQRDWIGLIASENLCLREGLRRQMESLNDELSESSDGPLERLAINRVKITFLQAAYFDQKLQALSVIQGPKEANRLAKRFEHANRQAHEALQSLASIRSLKAGVSSSQGESDTTKASPQVHSC